MCGIFCYIYSEGGDAAENYEWENCKDLINARGPDVSEHVFKRMTDKWSGNFVASVLWMQGWRRPVGQPCVDCEGNILLWNGDIFDGNLASDTNCDTTTILESFGSLKNLTNTLLEVCGPYSFIYFQKSTGLLYFGRDRIGRHSLLMKINDTKDSLTLCSVAKKNIANVVEVPAIGIFVCDLSSKELNLTCYPWKEPNLRFTDIIEELETTLQVDIDVKETPIKPGLSNLSMHLYPEIRDLEYLRNINCEQSFNDIMHQLSENKEVNKRVENILRYLKRSVEIRVKKKPPYCKNCIKLHLDGGKISCKHPKVGILFSGGLDSAILAVIADEYIPEGEEIDLLNVAFEKLTNPNSNHSKKCDTVNYEVPDRKTGKQTLAELKKICPNRNWNFIEVNVTQAELQKHRSSRICHLVYPLQTILDESLGCAVWFASRAEGILMPAETPYESPCRVLLLGMGADELFGGYMRHRTTLKHKGWGALSQELNVELERISERNLGRDDRIVSDHGRQSRLPYLDENLVTYVQKLKPWERCYPTDEMPVGLGDKLLLRLVARRIGLQSTANFPKRAFQFGSRIANGRENAKDISERL